MDVNQLRQLAAAGNLASKNRELAAALISASDMVDLFAIAVIPSLDENLKEQVRLAIIAKTSAVQSERMYLRLAAMLYPKDFVAD